MVLLEFSMEPLGKGESVGKYVARSHSGHLSPSKDLITLPVSF